MGEIIKWIFVFMIKVGFWASIIFTFFPLLTVLIATLLIALNDSIILDLYYMIQMYLPFNFNVILLWLFTITAAFCVWWLAQKMYHLLAGLVNH